jgi:hypothetical protein
MKREFGMRNEELGMPPTHPYHPHQRGGGWEFLIPHSYFFISLSFYLLIGWVVLWI